jgi:hypothetical protein
MAAAHSVILGDTLLDRLEVGVGEWAWRVII